MPRRHLLVPLTALLLGPSVANAAPALWKVSDGDSAVWLFGSVHMLPPGLDWRTDTLDKIMSKVDRIYFETDISPEAQVDIAPLSYELGFSRDGRLLSERMDSELTDRMRDAAEEYGVSMPLLLTMEPWMAASTLTLAVMATIGYDPALGVESTLSADVSAERRGFLETPEEQLNFLAGGTDEEQIAMLDATLASLDLLQEDIDAIVEAWMGGEPEALGEIFLSQMGDYDEGMVERLIDERNRNWVTQIDALLKNDETALLVVGAAHLVEEISVVRLLEQQGYQSERVQ